MNNYFKIGKNRLINKNQSNNDNDNRCVIISFKFFAFRIHSFKKLNKNMNYKIHCKIINLNSKHKN